MHKSIGEAAAILGLHPQTLRRWEREGKLLPAYRTAGGHRRYRLSEVLALCGSTPVEAQGLTVGYARVSGHDQKADLQRQAQRLRDHMASRGIAAAHYEVIEDLGSGLNYRKRGLRKLIKLLVSGRVNRLVLTYPDRLLRFGSELIFDVCAHMGVQVEVLSASPEPQSPQERLCAEVIELMTVFCARLHGQRSRAHRVQQQAAA